MAQPGQKRQLLKPGEGDRKGLETVFRALSRRSPVYTGSKPSMLWRVFLILRSLDFEGEVAHKLSHRLAPGRRIRLTVPVNFENDAEAIALEWARSNFPEIEFYLPYIRLSQERRQRLGLSGLNQPEPEYDEDGFLTE